jgi:hypothetical protein
MMYCTNCGFKLPDEPAAFCTECGARIAETAHEDQAASVSPSISNNKRPLIALGLLGALGGIFYLGTGGLPFSDPTDLSRDDAKQLISSTNVQEARIPIAPDMAQCLIDEGLLKVGFMAATFSVTPAGQQYFSNFDYNIFSKSGSVVPGGSINFADVEVTGITSAVEDPKSPRSIEFGAVYDFTSLSGGNALPSCLTRIGGGDATATATLFDDGWRMEFSKLPMLVLAAEHDLGTDIPPANLNQDSNRDGNNGN